MRLDASLQSSNIWMWVLVSHILFHIFHMLVCGLWYFLVTLHFRVNLLVSWAWWDWPVTLLTNRCPSMLWHCWLCSGYLPIILSSVLHSLKLAVESVFVRCIAVTYMCQPQGQNLGNVVFALLHRESGTPCHSISVLLPSAENSSMLGSKLNVKVKE